jgi:hypothetical protein
LVLERAQLAAARSWLRRSGGGGHGVLAGLAHSFCRDLAGRARASLSRRPLLPRDRALVLPPAGKALAALLETALASFRSDKHD